jgi:hypothetical protein
MRYLLGDLPEEERARVEEEYFADDAAFENLVAVRDELTDLYARGELKGRERERFERHFLSTGPRRRRAREAEELIGFTTRVAAAEAPAQRARDVAWWRRPFLLTRAPALRYALAALVFCVALGGAWLLFRRAGAVPEERAAVNQPRTPEAVPTAQPGGGTQSPPEVENRDGGVVATPTPPPATPEPRSGRGPGKAVDRPPTPTTDAPSRAAAQVASILLTPVLTRDAGQPNTLRLRPETTTARLQLPFEGGDYRRYFVVLRTVEGEQVWRGAAVPTRAAGAGVTATVNVPARVFRRQDHTATLYGVTPDGASHEVSDYFLTVLKGESR